MSTKNYKKNEFKIFQFLITFFTYSFEDEFVLHFFTPSIRNVNKNTNRLVLKWQKPYNQVYLVDASQLLFLILLTRHLQIYRYYNGVFSSFQGQRHVIKFHIGLKLRINGYHRKTKSGFQTTSHSNVVHDYGVL